MDKWLSSTAIEGNTLTLMETKFGWKGQQLIIHDQLLANGFASISIAKEDRLVIRWQIIWLATFWKWNNLRQLIFHRFSDRKCL